MEWILKLLADLLQAYVDGVNLAIADHSFLDQAQLLFYPLAFVGMVYSTIRWLWRRLSQHDERLDERARVAEKKLEQSEKKIAEVRKRNDELLKFDPEIFIAEMDRVTRDRVMSKLHSLPSEWLSPFRPALARAYSSLSKELLLRASDTEDLDEARYSAWGAIAADPWAKEHFDILTEIEEAREVIEFESLPEHEIAALKLPRVKQDPQALIAAGHSMFNRRKYKVARLFFGRAYELADISEGPSGQTSLHAKDSYAHALAYLGRYAEAEADFRAVWEIQRRPEVLGEEHPDHLRIKYWLARCLDGQEKQDHATQLLNGLLEQMTARLKRDHFWIGELENYLSERNLEKTKGENKEDES